MPTRKTTSGGRAKGAELPMAAYAAQPAMRRAVNRILGASSSCDPEVQSASPDDVVQTLLLKVIAKPELLPLDADDVEAYLVTAARHTTIDLLRRKRFETPTADVPSEYQAVDQMSNGAYRTRRPTRRRTGTYE